jgi:hypothetical protein
LGVTICVPWDFEIVPLDKLQDVNVQDLAGKTGVRILAELKYSAKLQDRNGDDLRIRVVWFPVYKKMFLSDQANFVQVQLGSTPTIRMLRVPLPFGEHGIAHLVPRGDSCIALFAPRQRVSRTSEECPTHLSWAIERIIATSEFAGK